MISNQHPVEKKVDQHSEAIKEKLKFFDLSHLAKNSCSLNGSMIGCLHTFLHTSAFTYIEKISTIFEVNSNYAKRKLLNIVSVKPGLKMESTSKIGVPGLVDIDVEIAAAIVVSGADDVAVDVEVNCFFFAGRGRISGP